DRGYSFWPDSDDYGLAMRKTEALGFLAHSALRAGRGQEAAELYQAAIEASNRNATYANEIKNWELPHLVMVAREHARLERTTPVYVHRMRIVYLDKTDVAFESKGKLIESKSALTPWEKERNEIFVGVMKRWLEAATEGKVSLAYSTQSGGHTLREMQIIETDSVEIRAPVMESASPSLEDTFS